MRCILVFFRKCPQWTILYHVKLKLFTTVIAIELSLPTNHRFCIGTLTYNALLPVQRFFSPFWTRRRKFQRTTERCRHTEYERICPVKFWYYNNLNHRNCYRKYTSKQNCSVFKTDQIIFYKYWTSFNYVTNKCCSTLPVRAHSVGFLFHLSK
jgi:hypothetical protein